MLCSRLSRVAVRAMPRPAPRYRVGGGGIELGCGIGNAPAARPLPRFLSSAAKVGRSSSARGYEEDMWAKENERKALADERWEKKEAAKREAMGGLSPEEEAAYQKDRARRATNRRRYWAARMSAKAKERVRQAEARATDKRAAAAIPEKITQMVLNEEGDEVMESFDFSYTEIKPEPERPVFGIQEIIGLVNTHDENEVAVYDIASRSVHHDYMVAVSCASVRHMQHMAETTYKTGRQLLVGDGTQSLLSIEGRDCDDWVLVDLGSVLVHFFMPGPRKKLHAEVEGQFSDLIVPQEDWPSLQDYAVSGRRSTVDTGKVPFYDEYSDEEENLAQHKA